MKKKDIEHPKLYFDFNCTNEGLELFYYSNQLDSAGSRLVKVVLLNQNSFSGIEMYKLNEKEYHNLNLYIERQERIMDTYLKKGFKDQFNIVGILICYSSMNYWTFDRVKRKMKSVSIPIK